MIGLLRDLAPALGIITAVALAAWRLGRHFGRLTGQVDTLGAGVNALRLAIEHLDRRLDALERSPTIIPRRTHGPRSPDPGHP